MLPEWVSLLPPWLVVGLGVGAVASLAVAGLFFVGESFFPAPAHPSPGATRFDGTVRRRAEIRGYLRDIGEPFREDVDVDGERVAFYLTGRDVAITFDAQAYFRLIGGGRETVLVEHEMPGAQLGRRLPFEVPERRPNPVETPVLAAFDHLGLAPSADPESVTASYRALAKDAHPDRGGDRESFKALQEAYATAKEHAAEN